MPSTYIRLYQLRAQRSERDVPIQTYQWLFCKCRQKTTYYRESPRAPENRGYVKNFKALTHEKCSDAYVLNNLSANIFVSQITRNSSKHISVSVCSRNLGPLKGMVVMTGDLLRPTKIGRRKTPNSGSVLGHTLQSVLHIWWIFILAQFSMCRDHNDIAFETTILRPSSDEICRTLSNRH